MTFLRRAKGFFASAFAVPSACARQSVARASKNATRGVARIIRWLKFSGQLDRKQQPQQAKKRMKMHPSLRNVTTAGFLVSVIMGLALPGCANRLGPVRATQSGGSTDHANLPDNMVERARECMELHGSQLKPGRVVLESTVEVNEDGATVGVTIADIPATAPDLGACMRNALRDMPIAEQPFREALETLKFHRKHANDSEGALRLFIEVIPGVPIVESELVLEVDGYTVVLPVTVKVRAELETLIDGDKRTLAKLGQLAIDTLGYDEIMRRAKQVGWLETVRKTQAKAPADKGLIAQSETEVVVVMFEVFTTHAVTAGVVSQLDSPLPGPADLAALGILTIGLYKAGAVAINALITATAPAPTASTPPPPAPPPPPPPRRYPNQTCENAELDRLEAEKKPICKPEGGIATTCNQNEKKLDKIPCSLIKLAIQQRQACKAARWEVQNKCFGGKPNPGHKKAIDQEQDAIDSCEARKPINCAKGHPMADK